DDAPPRITLLPRQARGAEPVDDGPEEALGHGEIEQDAAAETLRPVEFGQVSAQLFVGVGLEEIDGQIGHRAGKLFPNMLVDGAGMELAALPLDGVLDEIMQPVAPILGRTLVVIDADNGELVGQQAGFEQIVERRHDQPFGEVAARAEDHQGKGWRAGRARMRDVVRFSRRHLSPPGSTWPPKPWRIAESSLSAMLCSTRLRNRA